jgi:ParB/RepB/Spo0J family partition protein
MATTDGEVYNQDINTSPGATQQRVTKKMKNRGKKAVAKNTSALKELKVQYTAMDQIEPNEWNPNRQSDHDFELLTKSIEEDGFTQPIVVVKNDKNPKFKFKIVDGEHRWRAASVMGFEEIPVIEVPMTEAQAKIATFRHNRARGSEDYELAASLMKDLESIGALDWAQDSLMLSQVEIDRMLEDAPVPDVLGEEDWTEAWEPESAGQSEEGESTESVETKILDGASEGRVITASTIGAVNAQREKEKRIAEATTAEERQMIKRDSDIFKIYLSFTGEEAVLVKGVLGDRAAEKLVELCKACSEQNSN